MTTVLVTSDATQTSPPVHLELHVQATLHITAEETRRLVNRTLIPELGTGLVAQSPELVINGKQTSWRVPVVLSLPGLGDLGQVGSIHVDTQTGNLQSTPAIQKDIIQHARRLYTGATLQTK
ncbi:MAG TPA: hypothetical protein PLD25_31335 [Chloroflexota bacterium]|nr:hypothetical protein [Chloroflexota bacterium]HUM72340.1 hypothetical protein [Chloroflexota bacterium]